MSPRSWIEHCTRDQQIWGPIHTADHIHVEVLGKRLSLLTQQMGTFGVKIVSDWLKLPVYVHAVCVVFSEER